MSEAKDQVIEALKNVEDPELGMDVWTLGLIYDIVVKEKKVFIKMTFTSPACPYAPQLVTQIKIAVQEKGFEDPELEFTFDPPWEPNDEVKMLLGLS